MIATPPLPTWIREARVPDYVTAHALCPQETRLYGTESLYGDWSGQVLLLAKDFAPSQLLRQRIDAGDARPYRHEPSWRTNKRLRRFAHLHQKQGTLYGSALANLLRDDGERSGELPHREEAMEYGTRVLRSVVERMPRLCWIMCLGQDAWECACREANVEGAWREHRDRGLPLGRLIAAFHPAARVSKERMERPWQILSS